jgi:hypothetical protein
MTGWAQIAWATGGEARLLAISADAVSLESTAPAPPGARIEGALLGGSGRTLRLKVHSVRKEASGRFRIDGRPIDLTREAREELQGLAEGGPAGQ